MINHSMNMAYPATRWQDATPCGNGKISTLMYGNIHEELIVVNHENLWLKGEKPIFGQFDSNCLKELRKMILEGRYREASSYYIDKVSEGYKRPLYVVEPYQPAFDIILKTNNSHAFTDYSRTLSFETGEAIVSWKEEDTLFERRNFVSRKDDAIIMEYQSKGDKKVNSIITLAPHDFQSLSSMGAGRDLEKNIDYITYEVISEENWLIFKCRQKNGDKYGGVAKIICQKGKFESEIGSIKVEYADKVTLILKLYLNESEDVAVQKLKQEINDISHSYDNLLKRHMEHHLPLYHSIELDLKTEEDDSSNETLLQKSYNGNVETALVEKMFHYGRYLFISSSCSGGMPPNLQGIWNGDYNPAWASDYHNDENIQMNYWHALTGNLPELVLPYFDYYESMLEDFKTNARNIYGCRGILAPISQTTSGLVWPDCWMFWTAGAGWLAQLFYDYWLFTGDREFLRNRAIPFLKEVALFYEDFAFEDKTGKLVFAPSLSPENEPDIQNKSIMTVNATMDIAIAKEVLQNLCDAYRVLEINFDEIDKWVEMLSKLPEYEVNEDGAMREWLYSGLKDNYHHRHLSHIYPLFPGFEVTQESDIQLYKAMEVAVEKRLVIGLESQSGWSLAHMANIYARLGKGDRALECVELLCRSCVGPNLFTYHNDWRSQGITMFWGHGNQPPFQIDANFGITAAVLEMLIFSKPGMIKILPALPTKWRKGKVDGLQCRGRVCVSIEWDLDAGNLNIVITSKLYQEMTIKFPYSPRNIICSSRDTVIQRSCYGDCYREMKIPEDSIVNLNIFF